MPGNAHQARPPSAMAEIAAEAPSSKRPKRPKPPAGQLVELSGARYITLEPLSGSNQQPLAQILADGSVGPVVGHMSGGSIVLDEEAEAGEWVGELLTATVLREHTARGLDLPAAVHEQLRQRRPVALPGFIDEQTIAGCRAEMAKLDADRVLRSETHAQAVSTRGDRICFLDLCRDAGDDGDSDGDDGEEGDEEGNRPCPRGLRSVFDILEGAALAVQDALGLPLLRPRLGMAATYADGVHGYVRHLDNEPEPGSAHSSAPMRWRNFRALTAICYLNEPDWKEEDGGCLRCYAADGPGNSPGDVSGALDLEVTPRGGTVVLFPSCVTPHEVLPSARPRRAVTLWLLSSALLGPTGADTGGAAAAGGGAEAAGAAGARPEARSHGRPELEHTSTADDGVRDPQAVAPAEGGDFKFGF